MATLSRQLYEEEIWSDDRPMYSFYRTYLLFAPYPSNADARVIATTTTGIPGVRVKTGNTEKYCLKNCLCSFINPTGCGRPNDDGRVSLNFKH